MIILEEFHSPAWARNHDPFGTQDQERPGGGDTEPLDDEDLRQAPHLQPFARAHRAAPTTAPPPPQTGEGTFAGS